MAEVRIGRRRQRKIIAAANPPEVLNLPPGFNDLTAEEHRIFADMDIDNSTEQPIERAVPARAAAIEKTIFVYPRALRTRNEKANVRNWQLNNTLNALGDTRSEILFLLDEQQKTKQNLKDLKRARARHGDLLAQAQLKAADVIGVGGTPIVIPGWIQILPVLEN